MQSLLKELSRQIFDNFLCRSCITSLSKDSPWFDYICKNHPDVVNNLSCEEIISGLKEADVDIISVAKSKTKHYFSWHLSCVSPLSIHYRYFITLYYALCLSTMSLYANALWVVQYKNFELWWERGNSQVSCMFMHNYRYVDDVNLTTST